MHEKHNVPPCGPVPEEEGAPPSELVQLAARIIAAITPCPDPSIFSIGSESRIAAPVRQWSFVCHDWSRQMCGIPLAVGVSNPIGARMTAWRRTVAYAFLRRVCAHRRDLGDRPIHWIAKGH